jgi:two-component system, chemotaxis family, sensor kinase CheA
MNPLLEQFLSEARESLQNAGVKLMHLENDPGNALVMVELFRLVHTLKGNSGLFDFPEMTRVLHAAEDLMDAVRSGKVTYSPTLADRLLDAMDFVGILCEEIETDGKSDLAHGADSVQLAEKLRQLIGQGEAPRQQGEGNGATPAAVNADTTPECTVEYFPLLANVPEEVLIKAYRAGRHGKPLHLLTYSPLEDCFFQGDDPFFQAQHTPGILWATITAREPWPTLAELDAYRCILDFHILSEAGLEELNDHYRYLVDQLRIEKVSPTACIVPQGDPNGGPVYNDFVTDALGLLHRGELQQLSLTVQSMLELSNPELWFSSALRWLQVVLEFSDSDCAVLEAIISSVQTMATPQFALPTAAKPACAGYKEGTTDTNLPAEAWQLLPSATKDDLTTIVTAQAEILALPDDEPWLCGRIQGVAATLSGCLQATGKAALLGELAAVTEQAVAIKSAQHLRQWLASTFKDFIEKVPEEPGQTGNQQHRELLAEPRTASNLAFQTKSTSPQREEEIKFGRRAEDSVVGAKILKVDQGKIDRLMNLIGEMVVAKNALPYLAGRAEAVFGIRELSREIKTQYAVINRIAEEMQHSIMQVRMMPVSFIFQRFPRLVRDISHRLAKEVNLVLEGEDTEADKNIIEALGDPLMHIVRNSLDHGIELPDVRLAAGKPPSGTLTIRARQESDRVLIEITDDGKGIDPQSIKLKAFEKGIIDEEKLARLSDQEAVNLVFAAGFSTADEISDLSGRGVGMDVVRSAVERVNGSLHLESTKNVGTRLCLSLPLSMAVTNAMIVESNERIFGVPIDVVVETVRVPRQAIRTIKNSLTTVLRGRIIPLKSLNTLLGLATPQKANDEDELAVLVVNHMGEAVGIMVDNFRETVDIILKPMAGVLAGLTAYSGSALLGDGSVLMILNIKEIL